MFAFFHFAPIKYKHPHGIKEEQEGNKYGDNLFHFGAKIINILEYLVFPYYAKISMSLIYLSAMESEYKYARCNFEYVGCNFESSNFILCSSTSKKLLLKFQNLDLKPANPLLKTEPQNSNPASPMSNPDYPYPKTDSSYSNQKLFRPKASPSIP